MHELIECSTTEEKLLITLIDRIEDLQRNLDSLRREVAGNPLEALTPLTCPSVAREGQNIAGRLHATQACSFSTDPGLFAVSCQIRHQRNVDLLRRNGFEVVQSFGKPLPTDFYTVTWTHSSP